MTQQSETARLLAEKARAKQKKEKVRNIIGMVVLGVAFLWSAAVVAVRSFDRGLLSDKPTIRFAHWQLEGDTVNAIEWAIEDYKKVNPDVRVLQIPVPERAYQQWIRVRLIGRTAPDLIEINPWQWQNIIVKYFTPIGEYIDRPNPYNSGEFAEAKDPELVYPDDRPDLEGVPWRQTYADNMEGSWVNDLQDYYGMPMSIFTIRVFANADLLSEATGLSKKELRALVGVPTAGDLQEAAEGNSDGTGPGRPDFTLSDFFAMCEQIKQLARDKGDEGSIVPIAGSKYIAQIFQNRYFQMAFWGLRPDLDLDYNGSSSTAERIRAIFTGRLNLETNPQVAAAHKLLYEISRQFNPGFAQSDRDLSVFLFTQGKAAMIATGSWEAGTLYGIVGGEFDILVFDFPLAGPDSKYAEYIQERISEAGLQAGFAMGLTKHSTHKAEAVDFMHFLTSRRINEQLNKRFKWFPAIRGAGTVPELTNFRPKVEGIWKVFEMHVGSDTLREYEQAYQGFIGKEHIRSLDAHFQQFIEGYEKKFGQLALSDFQKGYRARYDRITQMERQAADARMRVIRADKEIDQLDPVLRRNLVSLVAGSAGAKVTREQEQALVEQVREQTGGNIQKQSPSQPEDRP